MRGSGGHRPESEKDHAQCSNGKVGNDGRNATLPSTPLTAPHADEQGDNAISVLAVARRGTMFDPSAVFYMNKIAVGPGAAHVLDITAPISENIRAVIGQRPVDCET